MALRFNNSIFLWSFMEPTELHIRISQLSKKAVGSIKYSSVFNDNLM